MMHAHFRGALTMPIDASISLLHTVGIPWNLVVDEKRTVILEVETFTGRIRCEENAHVRFIRVSLKRGLYFFPVVLGHTSVNCHEPIASARALSRESTFC